MKKYNKVLILSDLHSPWINWDAIKQAHKWYKKHKPELVVCTGDLLDQKIWSRWPKDLDDFSPEHEFKQAERQIKKLYKMFPKMVILRGNHDYRILNRAVEAGIPSKMFKDIDQVFDFKGWTWLKPDDKFIIDTPRGKVLFQHGDEMSGTCEAKSRRLGLSLIQGHTHKASITYTQVLDSHIFGAEAGCLMDVTSKAAKYASKNPIGVSIGFMVLKYGCPYFIAYLKNTKV